MYGVLYLWWYYAQGARTTTALREKARQRGYIVILSYATHMPRMLLLLIKGLLAGAMALTTSIPAAAAVTVLGSTAVITAGCGDQSADDEDGGDNGDEDQNDDGDDRDEDQNDDRDDN